MLCFHVVATCWSSVGNTLMRGKCLVQPTSKGPNYPFNACVWVLCVCVCVCVLWACLVCVMGLSFKNNNWVKTLNFPLGINKMCLICPSPSSSGYSFFIYQNLFLLPDCIRWIATIWEKPLVPLSALLPMQYTLQFWFKCCLGSIYANLLKSCHCCSSCWLSDLHSCICQ